MNYDLGSTLKTIRQDRNLTQAELAQSSGVSNTIISRIENNRIKDPRLTTLIKLAEGLGVTPSEFLNKARVQRTTADAVLSFLRNHRPKLRSDFHVKSIGLFGSVARGESTGESDVDILVEYEDGHRDIFNHSRLEEYLESNLERSVDLVMGSEEARESHPRITENIEEELIRV